MEIMVLVISFISMVVSGYVCFEIVGINDKIKSIIHTIKNKINPPQVMTEEEYKKMWRDYYRK